MAIPLTVNNSTFNYPEDGNELWGVPATSWAVEVTKVIAGLSTPLAGTKSTTGHLRLSNSDSIGWRSALAAKDWRLLVDSNDDLIFTDGSTSINISAAGGGNVVGPGSSTDNAIARYDATTGQLLQDSSVLVGDGGELSGITTFNSTGLMTVDDNLTATGLVTAAALTTTIAGITSAGSVSATNLSMNGVSPDITAVNGGIDWTQAFDVDNVSWTDGNDGLVYFRISSAASGIDSFIRGNFDITGELSLGSISSVGATAIFDGTARATGTSVNTTGVAISTSCGNFTSSSTSFVSVPNLSATIQALGTRPVRIELIPDGSGDDSILDVSDSSGTSVAACEIAIRRGGTIIARSGIQTSALSSNLEFVAVPPGSVTTVDTPSAGSITYDVQVRVINSNNSVGIRRCKLVVSHI